MSMSSDDISALNLPSNSNPSDGPEVPSSPASVIILVSGKHAMSKLK